MSLPISIPFARYYNFLPTLGPIVHPPTCIHSLSDACDCLQRFPTAAILIAFLTPSHLNVRTISVVFPLGHFGRRPPSRLLGPLCLMWWLPGGRRGLWWWGGRRRVFRLNNSNIKREKREGGKQNGGRENERVQWNFAEQILWVVKQKGPPVERRDIWGWSFLFFFVLSCSLMHR